MQEQQQSRWTCKQAGHDEKCPDGVGRAIEAILDEDAHQPMPSGGICLRVNGAGRHRHHLLDQYHLSEPQPAAKQQLRCGQRLYEPS